MWKNHFAWLKRQSFLHHMGSYPLSLFVLRFTFDSTFRKTFMTNNDYTLSPTPRKFPRGFIFFGPNWLLEATRGLSRAEAKAARIVFSTAVIAIAVNLILIPLLFAVDGLVESSIVGAVGQLLCVIGLALGIFLMAKRRFSAARLLIFVLGITEIVMFCLLYGHETQIQMFLFPIFVICRFVFPAKERLIGVFASAAACIAFLGIEIYFGVFEGRPMMPPTGGQLIFSLADVAFAFLFAGLIVGHYTKENESYELQLEMERRRSEALLLNILPPSIAARLQSGESNIADQHAEVTVLFADVVGFTPLAAGLDPTQTIKLLNSLFTAFDAIADKWGVEKIKTIGDSYMLVAGAPLPFDDHAERAAGAAIDLQREAAKLTVDGKKLSLRIGIHSGPVAAGVIGSRKFTYDLWGDTVNLASRLENISSDGRITVSAATAALLCESSFRLIPRGKLTIKGKGELEAFFLEGGDDCSFAA